MSGQHSEEGRPGGRLAEVIAQAQQQGAPGERDEIGAFVARYYAHVEPEDLAERSVADLAGGALSLWRFARERSPGRAKIRVFNPVPAEHGWQSVHTVVEIANDDMPFLVDSVTMEVNRHGLAQHLIIHPIIPLRREADGVLAALAGGSGGQPESLIHVEVDRIGDSTELAALAADLGRVLADVRAVVLDWQPMAAQARSLVTAAEAAPPALPPALLAESLAFLRWLVDDHFTFLGYRCYDVARVNDEDGLRLVPGSSLGILRDRPGKEPAAPFTVLPPEIREYARRPELLVVAKATARSTVHRPGYLDYVGVKRFDASGEFIGEHRFLGLFTSTAYSAKPEDIPLLRRKVANVVARAALPPGGHASKELLTVLETYPRDELFQIGEDELLPTALAILHLSDRQRFRLFVRRDPFERFLTCLVYVPRERYSTELRQKWQAVLAEVSNGSCSDFNVSLSESMLARIQITVRTTPGRIPPLDVPALEARLAALSRRWTDDLREALVAREGEAAAAGLCRRYATAFPAGYREDFTATAAVDDVRRIEALRQGARHSLALYRRGDAGNMLRFKLLRAGDPVPLSESLPMLERMGFRVLDEHPYRITLDDGSAISLHDFGLVTATGEGTAEIDVGALHGLFEAGFAAVFEGEVENDDFNRLIIAARLPVHDVVVLRAYAKYMRQGGFALSQAFIAATLAAYPAIARLLVDLFKARFDPALGAESLALAAQAKRGIETAADAVANLSEDRVLRHYLALIDATTRTNFWRRAADGARRSFLSFKFDPARVPGLPEPRPMFEIFVYAPRFEGVHLRGGRVARGGLRWSDRPEDFRTEVLGLVKAQMVKNVVIVPVGSKGGFVLKRAPSPAHRDAYLAEGVACYQDYLRGLLDLTDNRVGDTIVPPPQVKRHDADDPYLVVAADKGTASFSDYANAISAEYGFWLGDAFASGGSAGYDHKEMGITARGAWEAAKRHFRELGVDIQTTDFTVAGIGDMSGDVFGNGMLLSRHIRLVAAFDHRHIFLDPDPDAATSFAERERLFHLPRSSWADYDAKLISAGGGVYPRSVKAIPVSPPMQAVLGVAVDQMTPSELMTAILKAPVDLIYNGGIGTYVKATRESHADVGDRANDAVRIDGRELRCKAFVEGGNLGCTQLGRVEYARAGGRINTDAIDNSGGVGTSDHEVNIKILVGAAVADGRLTLETRDRLLATMTDDVAERVLRDNYFQTQVLSVTRHIAPQLLDAQQRFIQFLEKAGRLNRTIEYLPGDDEIAERRRAHAGLTSPEHAVLLAYAKIWLYDDLLTSALPDDPWISRTLVRYFPAALAEGYAADMARHPLKREIIATHVTNSVLNRVGSTFVHRLMESTGAAAHEVVRAFLLTRETFGFVPLWRQIEALDGRIADAVQAQLLIDASRLIDRGTTWFLRSRRLQDDITATIERFAPGVEALAMALPRLVDGDDKAQLDAAVDRSIGQGIPPELAARVVALDTLYATLDLVEEASHSGRPVETVARVYFDVSGRLGLPWLRGQIAALPADHHWQMLARAAMEDDLSGLQRAITRDVLAGGAELTAPKLVAGWFDRNRRAIERVNRLRGELQDGPSPDAAMLSVALREVRNLAG